MPATAARRKTTPKPDTSATYNRYKKFEGKQYTGMAVGRRHHWHYDQGDWTEKKVTPDKWEFSFAVTKRRKGHAPEGSGVPVGTEYHWYILADQTARKLNANDYTTTMSGLKFKLAHKRFDHEHWNLSGQAQRQRLIAILEETLEQLKNGAGEDEAPPAHAKTPVRRHKRLEL